MQTLNPEIASKTLLAVIQSEISQAFQKHAGAYLSWTELGNIARLLKTYGKPMGADVKIELIPGAQVGPDVPVYDLEELLKAVPDRREAAKVIAAILKAAHVKGNYLTLAVKVGNGHQVARFTIGLEELKDPEKLRQTIEQKIAQAKETTVHSQVETFFEKVKAFLSHKLVPEDMLKNVQNPHLKEVLEKLSHFTVGDALFYVLAAFICGFIAYQLWKLFLKAVIKGMAKVATGSMMSPATKEVFVGLTIFDLFEQIDITQLIKEAENFLFDYSNKVSTVQETVGSKVPLPKEQTNKLAFVIFLMIGSMAGIGTAVLVFGFKAVLLFAGHLLWGLLSGLVNLAVDVVTFVTKFFVSAVMDVLSGLFKLVMGISALSIILAALAGLLYVMAKVVSKTGTMGQYNIHQKLEQFLQKAKSFKMDAEQEKAAFVFGLASKKLEKLKSKVSK